MRKTIMGNSLDCLIFQNGFKLGAIKPWAYATSL